ASTEVRVPLLDDELVALAEAIPPQLKLRGTTRKHVFKEGMGGVLPDDLITRRKAGFGAPIRSWLVGELRPMVHDLLSRDAVASGRVLAPAAVERMISDEEAGVSYNALRIWALLCLETWKQNGTTASL